MLTFENCEFVHNYGDVLFDFTLSADISNCHFINNTSSIDGGAIQAFGATLKVRNVIFEKTPAGKMEEQYLP